MMGWSLPLPPDEWTEPLSGVWVRALALDDPLLGGKDLLATVYRDVAGHVWVEVAGPNGGVRVQSRPPLVDTGGRPLTPDVPVSRGADRVSRRVFSLIFNGISRGLPVTFWMPLTEREQLAAAVFDELRAGGVEVRLADGFPTVRPVSDEIAEIPGGAS